MRPLVIALLAFALIAVKATHGQQADTTPTAIPARPTITNPAALTPVGYVQFEQGFNQASTSPGLDHQFSIVQSTKLAVHPHLLVQVITQPFARTLLPPISKDQGDIILAGQVLLTPAPKTAPEASASPDADTKTSKNPASDSASKNDKKAPPFSITAVSVAYLGRVRTGTSPDLDIGSFSRGVVVFADGTFPGLTFTGNFLVNEQSSSALPTHPVRRAQMGQTLSVSRQLSKKASFTVEFWHFTQPTISAARNGDPVARAHAAGLLFTGGYALHNNLVFDAGFEHGLTSTSTNWQSFAGVTYVLPHRLWPDKHAAGK